ncbi:chemotaxis protein CheW [Marivibrio halodurans]|uniref:Chemotaxis protein CheW n=1 Tax=Marivibrio halodurans TaxID=2039722 RepID=A0A8J7S011_9PROT|nr:chemotaxis protein CheW [Marivibrio halodurans]MBP5856183.1 chemotaxis protein CheW [Marivibrio halodurans]
MGHDGSDASQRYDWKGALARIDRALARVESGGTPSPDDARRKLKQRAEAIAPPRAEPDVAPPVDVIEFAIAAERFAIPLTDGAAAAPLTGMTALPGVPSFYLGLLSHHGTIYPVIDVRPLLSSGTADEETDMRYALLVRNETGALGLAASDVEGITRYRAKEIAEVEESANARALLGIGPRRTAIIDVRRLMADFRLVVDDQPRVAGAWGEGNE